MRLSFPLLEVIFFGLEAGTEVVNPLYSNYQEENICVYELEFFLTTDFTVDEGEGRLSSSRV